MALGSAAGFPCPRHRGGGLSLGYSYWWWLAPHSTEKMASSSGPQAGSVHPLSLAVQLSRLTIFLLLLSQLKCSECKRDG